MAGSWGSGRRIRAAALAVAAVAGSMVLASSPAVANGTAAPTTGSVVGVERIAGIDRYETAAMLSEHTYAAPVDVVYIATGESFPDALAGGPAAAARRGPVLLVRQNAIPVATAGELRRLQPKSIVVLGGSGAVSDAVAGRLLGFTSGTVTRTAGKDRYETSARISAASNPAGSKIAFVATGTSFPDALSGTPAASVLGGPILLVGGAGIPSSVRAELARLKPDSIFVLGGPGAVSGTVLSALGPYATSVVRWSGADRYATSAAISASVFRGDRTPDTVYVATGEAFPDALAGGAVAGFRGSPLLLVSRTSIPATIRAELTNLRPAHIIILGGHAAVSEAVKAALAAYVPGGGQVGSVSGTVRQANTPGVLLANVAVRAYQRDLGRELWSRNTVTHANGSFTLTGIPVTAGVVLEYVGASATGGTAHGGYASACRGDQGCFSATALVIPAGGTLNGQDVQLPGRGAVSGVVTFPDGSPAGNVHVRVCADLYLCQYVDSKADGSYAAVNVAATDRVWVCADSDDAAFSGCFDGKPNDSALATRFTVPTDGAVTGKDVVLKSVL